jgi:DNA invertase Pin-like site-specific DNA recombinase
MNDVQERSTKIRLSAIYSDAGVSGLAEHRPALDQLMLDLSHGRIRRVVIADASRLARSQQLEQHIQQRIRSNGATLTMPCPPVIARFTERRNICH